MNLKKNTKAVRRASRWRRSKNEDSLADEDQQLSNAREKRIASKEPVGKQRKSKSCEKGSNKVKKGSVKKSPSAEKVTEKEKGQDNSDVVAAGLSLCNYLINMKELSLSTYFDKNLASYTNPDQKATSAWEKNMAKNRSKDHKMLDHSRVKLSKEEPNDYINASRVTFENLETDFIVTQYPLAETTLDFWKMVVNEQSERIICIFEPYMDEAIEEFHKVPDTPSPMTPTSPTTNVSMSSDAAGTPKSEPKSQQQQNIVNNSCRCELGVTKSFFPLFTDNYFNINDWLINTKKVEVDDRNKTWLTTYTVELVPQLCSNSLNARVFNCSTWPWKKVPSDEKKLLALVRAPWKDLMPTYEAQKEGGVKKVRHKPVIVMCDLGIDRSATVVFTTVLVELVLDGKKVDCDKIFRDFRNQRAGVFTSSMFYTYAIRAALFYLRIKLKGERDVDELMTAIELALGKVPLTSTPPKK